MREKKLWIISLSLLVFGFFMFFALKIPGLHGGEDTVYADGPVVKVEQEASETLQGTPAEPELDEKQVAILWKPYSTAYASCEEIARAMHWEYAWDADSFLFQEDDIQYDFVVGSLLVTRQGKIMDVMPQSPILENQALYMSVDWLEEVFGSAILRRDDRIEIQNPEKISFYDVTLYFSDELKLVFKHPELPSSKRLMGAIELPRSMGIDIPKIDASRMLNMTPIAERAPEFRYELQAHGYSDEDIAALSYGEYRILEDHWLLPEEMQAWALRDFSEYSKEEVEKWTYGELSKRRKADTEKARLNRFSEEEWRSLQERGIVEADLFLLLKEYHQPSQIVMQSDETLKAILEGYYQFHIDYWIYNEND